VVFRDQPTSEQHVLRVIRLAAAARMALGVGMTFMTRRLVTAMVSEEDPSGHFLLFARTVGIRDALFGLGCLLAAGEQRQDDVRRWVSIWAANEVADVIAGLTAVRPLGRSGAVTAAAAPLPFVIIDAWALRHLPR
jgi:hypothetical protein